MAALPSSSVTVQDPGLGVTAPAVTTPAFVGTASKGPENTTVLVSTQKALTDTFGYGPGVEAALFSMQYAGGPILFTRATSSIAASNGSVTVNGSTPTPVITGASDSDYDVRIEILSTGILGAATFRYSLDAAPSASVSEMTFSGTQTVPAGGAYVLGSTGITVTFQTGSHVAGDVITFSAACAASSSSDVTTALNALDANLNPWRFVYVVTSANTGDSAAHSTIAAAFQSFLDGLCAKQKFRRGMMAANHDDADPTADWANDVADRLLVAFGRARVASPAPQTGHASPTVSAANSMAARAAGSLISTDLKRVRGNGVNDGGRLPGVLSITNDARNDGGEAWDNIGLSSLTTYRNRRGYYITQGRLKSAEGSDFTIWPRGIVMDVACETVDELQTTWIGIGVRTNNDGTIDERDALRLEAEMTVRLASRLTSPRNAEGTDGHVSDFRYRIDRSWNVLSTSTLLTELAIRPNANLDYITNTSGFAVNLGEAA